MQNKYIKLIQENKFTELITIDDISDLTSCTYLGKYLLEFLLERNIHSNSMDSFMENDILWIKLYLKYNLIKPLLNANPRLLLIIENNEFILESLLKQLNQNDRIKLFQNIKKNDYWFYRLNEEIIIKIYKKFSINISPVFIKLPSIYNPIPSSEKKLNSLIQEFKETYHDTNPIVLDAYTNELKRNYISNHDLVYNDIKKLIELKKNRPEFTISLSEYDYDDITTGMFNRETSKMLINTTQPGILANEMSHMQYSFYENKISSEYINKFQDIQKLMFKKPVIDNIISYLNNFHKRYDEFNKIIIKLYSAQVKNKYGSVTKYASKIKNDIINSHPKILDIDENIHIYIYKDSIEETLPFIIYSDISYYSYLLINSYYHEELALECFLSDLLMGELFDDKYNVDMTIGHEKECFTQNDTSFTECLASYYEIKNSYKANSTINTLRNIVGEELVDLFEEYINVNRNDKVKRKTF